MSASGYDPKAGKARRACDACRTRRLKCEYDSAIGACARCLSAGFTCESHRPPPEDNRPRTKRIRRRRRQESAPREDMGSGVSSAYPDLEPRYLGSTSLSSLVATVLTTIPTRSTDALKQVDEEHSHFRVGEEVVLVGRDEVPEPNGLASAGPRSQPIPIDTIQFRDVASESVLCALMQSYGVNFLNLYPVVSTSELCSIEPALALSLPHPKAQPPPTPLPARLAKLVICSIAALSRTVPRHIYHSLLSALTSHMDSPEGSRLLRTSCIGHVQLLLLLGISSELHSRSTCEGGSWSWLRVGAALRMALDIGLHRDLNSNAVPKHQLNRRRRVWGGVVTADRWYALSFGQPMTINLFDCDARGPSIYHDDYSGNLDQTEKPYSLHAEITKLSILLGRVVRSVHGPLGMDTSSNATFHTLQEDMENWQADLPASLRFYPEIGGQQPGLLLLLSCCVDSLYLRGFIAPRKAIPSRITYRPDATYWHTMERRTRLAIHWCATEGDFVLDVWFTVMYSLVWCFLAQLRQFTTTQSFEALDSMKEAERCLKRWAECGNDKQVIEGGLRAKVYGLVSFLTRNATAGAPPSLDHQFGTALETSFLVPTDIFAGSGSGPGITDNGHVLDGTPGGEAGMQFGSPPSNGAVERDILTDDFHLFDGGGLFDPAWFQNDLSDILGQFGQQQ